MAATFGQTEKACVHTFMDAMGAWTAPIANTVCPYRQALDAITNGLLTPFPLPISPGDSLVSAMIAAVIIVAKLSALGWFYSAVVKWDLRAITKNSGAVRLLAVLLYLIGVAVIFITWTVLCASLFSRYGDNILGVPGAILVSLILLCALFGAAPWAWLRFPGRGKDDAAVGLPFVENDHHDEDDDGNGGDGGGGHGGDGGGGNGGGHGGGGDGGG